MGKKSNAKLERKQGSRLNEFHITIGASSPSPPYTSFGRNSKISLEHELRLVKAALLYADRTTLCGFTTSMLALMLSLGNLTTRQKIDFLREQLPVLSKEPVTEETLKNWLIMTEMIDKKQWLSPEQLLAVQFFENTIDDQWVEVTNKIEGIAREAGVGQLLQARQLGLLDIHILGAATARGKPTVKIDDLRKKRGSNDQMLVEFVDFIARAVSSGRTYPLFDDMTGNFIQHAIKEDRLAITNTGVARSKHSVLAGNLLERLPLFDEAAIDEIIDIRKELDTPLIRFRQAIITFSEEMKLAAWDRDFSSLSGGALSVLLSQVSSVPQLASLALTGAGLASAGATVIVEYREMLKERQAIEQNQLFFYYRAGMSLAPPS